MDAISISENSLYPAYNPNLLPAFDMFNTLKTWSVSSGSGSASHATGIVYEGLRSLRVQSSVSLGITVNSGDTSTECIIPVGGLHIFSFRKYEADLGVNTNSIDTNINIFVNGSPIEATYYTELEDDQRNIWKTYYVALQLEQNDVVGFTISVGTSDVGTTYRQYFDGWKLEIDQFGIGYPTVYSPPQNLLPYVPTANGAYYLKVLDGVSTWETFTP